jgi:TolB-like protein
MSRAQPVRRHSLVPAVAMLAMLVAVPLATPRAGAQSAGGARVVNSPESRTAKPSIAVLDITFNGDLANGLQYADSLVAPQATVQLQDRFAELPGLAVVEPVRVDAAERSAEALAAAGGKPCVTVAACMRVVGQQTGAQWVASGRLSKISNLVWVFTAQLMEVETGRLVMNDDYEVKGVAGDMATIGARVFARRAAKKIAAAATAATTP